MTTCCSMQCEKRWNCAKHCFNNVGTYSSEDYFTLGSGSISSDGCKVTHWCGELGNYKMFKPKAIDYTIISKPSYIRFECPHCEEEVEVGFKEVDFKTDYWGDGAWVNCPECGREVELDNYEYD